MRQGNKRILVKNSSYSIFTIVMVAGLIVFFFSEDRSYNIISFCGYNECKLKIKSNCFWDIDNCGSGKLVDAISWKTNENCIVFKYGSSIYLLSKCFAIGDFLSCDPFKVGYSTGEVFASAHLDTVFYSNDFSLYLLKSELLETDYVQVSVLLADNEGNVIGFCELQGEDFSDVGIYRYVSIDSFSTNRLYYTVHESFWGPLTYTDSAFKKYVRGADLLCKFIEANNKGEIPMCLERREVFRVDFLNYDGLIVCDKHSMYSYYVITECYY